MQSSSHQYHCQYILLFITKLVLKFWDVVDWDSGFVVNVYYNALWFFIWLWAHISLYRNCDFTSVFSNIS